MTIDEYMAAPPLTLLVWHDTAGPTPRERLCFIPDALGPSHPSELGRVRVYVTEMKPPQYVLVALINLRIAGADDLLAREGGS